MVKNNNMSQSTKKQKVLFMLLGVAAVISGIIQTVDEKYFLGICAIIVGLWLAWKNFSEYKIK